MKRVLCCFALASAVACGSTSPAQQQQCDGGTCDAGQNTCDGGSCAPIPDAGFTIDAMPRISGGAPAFASNNNGNPPANADDDNPASGWVTASLPAWIAYDLSAVPSANRQQVLIAWYAGKIEDYIFSSANNPTDAMEPTDYTLEINAAAGGGQPPTTGWTQVASVTGNTRSSRQHLVNLGGANWVRMTITNGTNPANEFIDLDVHAANSGATDDWLFMGDSITFISTPRLFSDLPNLVHAANSAYYPAVIDGAIGGTNTVTASSIIDDTMSLFPGKFVTLDYGSNDDPANYQMETLIQHVIAAGKTPVVPHMPWSSQKPQSTNGPLINAQIDALYTKYPQVVRGPDLYAFFNGRTDLFGNGDGTGDQLHPNSAGQEALRGEWALLMESLYKK